MTRLALLLAILTCLPLQHVRAQDTLAVKPGQRVRVTAPALGMQRQEETFQELRGDTLVFSSTQFRLSEVTRLEQYSGQESWGRLGALMGLFAGGVVGNSLHFAEPLDLPHPFCGVLGAASGLLVGGIIGISTKIDRWEEVPLPPVQPFMKVLPDGRLGVGLSVSVRG